MSHWKIVAGIALLLVPSLLLPGRLPSRSDAGSVETIVLSLPGDPYHALAEDIAADESLPLRSTWNAALADRPLYLLWVAAPDSLNDPVMAEAGLALKGRAEPPAVGIITGASVEEAWALYQRGRQFRPLLESDRLYIANGEHASTGNVEPILTTVAGGQSAPAELTKASLRAALQQTLYLTFSGHGSARYLRISEDETFTAQALPDLPPLVIGTASCQTVRPWEEGSIALAFTGHGAAAYAGFVYSPNSGALIGDYHGLPFRFTSPEFPIGRVVALQNRGSLQSYANFPFYYLLGDPRIALNAEPPYRLNNTRGENGWRELSYQSVLPEGIVPVRIPGGAAYRFIEILPSHGPAVAGAADGDLFFNARLQVMNAQDDKYILFDHSGGPFTIRLRQSPPWHWAVTRPLLDSFDEVVLFFPQNGGGAIMVVLGLLALAAGLFRLWRQRAGCQGQWPRLFFTCLGIGLVTGLVFSLYALLRLPHSAISTKPLYFIPSFMIGVGILAAAGALLFLTARGWLGKIIAVLVSALPALLPGLFMAAAVGFINLMAFQRVGASIYGYRSALLTLPAVVMIMALMGGVYRWLTPDCCHRGWVGVASRERTSAGA